MCEKTGLPKEAVQANLLKNSGRTTVHAALLFAYCKKQGVPSREGLTDYEREMVRRHNLQFNTTGEIPDYAVPFAVFTP
jgi:hypothetical protein